MLVWVVSLHESYNGYLCSSQASMLLFNSSEICGGYNGNLSSTTSHNGKLTVLCIIQSATHYNLCLEFTVYFK